MREEEVDETFVKDREMVLRRRRSVVFTSEVAVSLEGCVHVLSRLFKIFQDWCLFGGFHATVG